MAIAHDIYSETNPAFCACALVTFIHAFITVNSDGPEVPTVYLSLPVALSGDLGECFVGTTKNTGLQEWLERSPQAQVGLSERVNLSINIVSEAIGFGCFTRVLRLDERARLLPGDRAIKKSAITALSEQSAQVIRRAERLGYWFAMAGSTRSAFNIMGLTL